MRWFGGRQRWRAVVAAVLAAAVFAVDAITPLGIAGGVPHVAVVALTLGMPGRGSTLVAAGVTSVLVVLGALASPGGGDPLAVVLNRSYALAALWVTALLVVQRKQRDERIEDSERRFREVAETAPGVFWVVSVTDGRTLYVSPRFERIWGRPKKALYADHNVWFAAIVERDRARVRRAFEESLATLAPFDEQYRVRQPDGRTLWLRDRGAPVLDARGRPVRFVGVAEDVTPIKLREQKLARVSSDLEKLAHLDPLTGQPNRRSMQKALIRESHRERRLGTRSAVALLDCDDFKRINDRYGHVVGDAVLKEIGERMAASLRPTDCLARVGGDEFMILLPDTRLAEAAQVAERIRLAVAGRPLTYVKLSDKKVVVTVSIGVALIPRGTASIEEVLEVSRNTLARSKKAGKNRVVVKGESRSVVTGDRSADLVDRLSEEDCLRVVAQPLVRLDAGEVVGYEALIRGPAGPFENPVDLFRLCHEKNILTLVDLKCVRQCITWARQRAIEGRLHVNVFPSTVLDTPPAQLADCLRAEAGLEVCVELSEQQFVSDPGYLRARVHFLRERGVKIAIDDVGFGRSSLESLVLLEPDVIKIDQSLIREVDRDPGRQRDLVRMMGVCRSLSARVVAEGVETEAEREFLRRLGVPEAQGYLWGRPSPEPVSLPLN